MEGKEKRAWFWAIGYTLFLLGTISLVPPLASFLRERNRLRLSIWVVYLLSGTISLYFLFFKWRLRSGRAFLALAGLFSLFLIAVARLDLPVERLHFFEYGLLFAFLYRSLSFRFRGVLLYGITMGFTFFVSCGDEGLQGMTPNRIFDIRDVWTNLFAGHLAAGTITIVEKYRSDRLSLIKETSRAEGDSPQGFLFWIASLFLVFSGLLAMGHSLFL